MKVIPVPLDLQTMVISADFSLGDAVSDKIALTEIRYILNQDRSRETLRPIRAAFIIEHTERGVSLEFEVENAVLSYEVNTFVYDGDGTVVGLGGWLSSTKPYLFVRLYM